MTMTVVLPRSSATVEPFDVRVDHTHALPGRTLARLSGEVDICAASRLLGLAQVAAACSRDVVLDLAEVTFIDGAGVASLVDAQQALTRCGQYLFLRDV